MTAHGASDARPHSSDSPSNSREAVTGSARAAPGSREDAARRGHSLIPVGLRLATRHLTILPVPRHPAEAAARPAISLVWFPVVGLVVGLPVYVILHAPIAALPRAALALAVWVAVAGGLHEDGLMDCADAAFATADRERRLEILRDPRVGAHGLSAGALTFLLRFAALTVVPSAAGLLAPVLGRWLMAVVLARVPPARTDGLGAAFADGARAWPATLAAFALTAVLAPLTGPGPAVAAAAAALGGGGLAAAFLARRFGGLNGDVCGAAGLLAETAALYAFVPIFT